MVITNTKIKILSLFLANPKKDFTIREISLTAKINYRLVYEEVLDLNQKNLLAVRKKGSSKLCLINLSGDIPLYSYVEHLRLKAFQKTHPSLKVIINELNKTSTTYYTALLFGSHVSGKAKKDSDFDLLFVVPTTTNLNKFEKEINSRMNLLSYPLDLNIISEESFLEMKNSSKLNLINEIIPNHLILKGAENYYALLEK